MRVSRRAMRCRAALSARPRSSLAFMRIPCGTNSVLSRRGASPAASKEVAQARSGEPATPISNWRVVEEDAPAPLWNCCAPSFGDPGSSCNC